MKRARDIDKSRLDGRLRRDVADEGRAVHCLGHVAGGIAINIEDGDSGALSGECPSGGCADRSASACDHHHGACETPWRLLAKLGLLQ